MPGSPKQHVRDMCRKKLEVPEPLQRQHTLFKHCKPGSGSTRPIRVIRVKPFPPQNNPWPPYRVHGRRVQVSSHDPTAKCHNQSGTAHESRVELCNGRQHGRRPLARAATDTRNMHHVTVIEAVSTFTESTITTQHHAAYSHNNTAAMLWMCVTHSSARHQSQQTRL